MIRNVAKGHVVRTARARDALARIGSRALTESEPRVRVGAGQRRPAAGTRADPIVQHRVPVDRAAPPASRGPDAIGEQQRAPRLPQHSSRHSLSAFSHSRPSNGASQSLQRSSGLGDPGCAAMPNAAEPVHVFDRRRAACPPSGYGVGGRPSATKWPPLGADLDGVDAQHARSIRRRLRRARAVAVIGEDDELQSGARGRGRDLVDRAAAVRSAECTWIRAAHHRPARRDQSHRRRRGACRRQQRDGATAPGRARRATTARAARPQLAQFTRAGGTDRRPCACRARGCACRSAWSTGRRGRASSGSRAGRRRARAGASQTNGAARAD